MTIKFVFFYKVKDYSEAMKHLLFLLLFCSIFNGVSGKTVVRVGHFPNITHAQGVIGHHFSREKKGWFEKKLGPDVEVQWYVYEAGPSAMEGIFAGSIDMTYVGPSPTINAFIRSDGEEVRILCGACSGGSALVVQPGGNIKTDADFKGKRIGTPEFGNTQDVAARAWLKSIGLKITQTGGDALVIPTEPASQLPLFQKKDLDAVWTVEPWVSQLVLNAQARIYLEESALWPETGGKYVTTHLVCSKAFLDKHPDLAKKWVLAHVELTNWINANSKKAKELFNVEFKNETHVPMQADVLNRAWEQIEFTSDPIQLSLFKDAKNAYLVGFLKKEPDINGIYDLQFLKARH